VVLVSQGDDVTEDGGERATRTRDERAWQLIERCGYASAALAVLPIPLSETVGVAAVHVTMVMGVAKTYGVELTRDSAMKFVLRLGATVGLSYLGSRLALGAAKLILPAIPGLLAAPLVFASTLGLGAVAKAHFENPGQELTDDEVRTLYKSAIDRAKASFDPRRVRSRDAREDAEVMAAPEPAPVPTPTPMVDRARERLERLVRLRDQGFLGAEEFEAASKKVLEE
jgi:uncharacterized protein (DUF697 family)